MKKLVIIFLSFILILSIVNLGILKSAISHNSIAESENGINTSIYNEAEEHQILQNLNRLDGYFTENRGQVGNDYVRYYIQEKGVWFLDDGVVFEIQENLKVESRESGGRESDDPYDRLQTEREFEVPAPRKSVVIKLNFDGCNKVELKGVGLLPHRSNFFYGKDSSNWYTKVVNYQELLYENIYDNIDLRYYTTEKGLKYDFIIHPFGDPNKIRISYEGVEEMYIDSNGNLILNTPLGTIIDSELFIYQDINNNENKIEGKFNIIDPMSYGFNIMGKYDNNKAIIIDPLVYSTYIGGSGEDYGRSIALDSTGNAYLTGYTHSSNFPITSGANDTTHNGNADVFVAKLNPAGNSVFDLIYSTFVGGSNIDRAYGIALDSTGNAYVTGYTYSSNFPITPGANDTTYNGVVDGFVIKLNPTGSTLLYSTFFGGSNDDRGHAIALDSGSNAYVTGYTKSANFLIVPGANDPTHNGLEDGFVLKLNPTGSTLLYSTFVGGSNDDCGYGIALDSTGNAYVTGYTFSSNFPKTTGANDTTYNGGGDGFILKLNPTGSTRLYTTFFGGTSQDCGYGITIDSTGNAYVTGSTYGSNFPTAPANVYDATYNGNGDGFALKLNPTGSTVLYSTYVGGSEADGGTSIALDSTGNAYVTGRTQSPNFPTTSASAYDTTYNGGFDIIVLKLNPTGSTLLYSTFVGGSESEDGYGIVIGSTNNTYIVGRTGSSSDFPITSGAYDTSYNGDFRDVFMFRLGLGSSNPPFGIDLKISKPRVLRTNSIYLFSNATDIEDPENQLTPYFEYRDPDYSLWNITYFSSSQYLNSRWEVSYTPPKNATLGLYDFRVKFNDTGGLFSSWFYLNDSLSVL
ncbi:MAG: SBBP repeat-containing protein, partial [Thermoplasmata archaeon]|nr:SBBP repeat-containing protein [Thermoplasmata archaeon]